MLDQVLSGLFGCPVLCGGLKGLQGITYTRWEDVRAAGLGLDIVAFRALGVWG